MFLRRGVGLPKYPSLWRVSFVVALKFVSHFSNFWLQKMEVKVTAIAPVNIAVIKYWGKRDEDLILPVNSSLSLTMHMDSLRSKTTITASPQFNDDTMLLNEK
jgi:hypothetical protein